MKKILLVLFAALVTGTMFAQAPQFGKAPLKEVIKAMTVEEKAKIVVGKGFIIAGLNMGQTDKTPDKIEGVSGHTVPIARLGIPSAALADGPSGVHRFMTGKDSANGYFTTAFPIGTLLASSWDTALVRKVGTAFGAEIKACGIDFILGPGMNIHRNPLGGRNFEYYSEDPLVTGEIAAAIIKGIQSQGVGATVKHFAANNQETNRNSVNTIVSERTLREIYLRAFEIAIKKSQPWAVMSSYNLINGTFASESSDLLKTILKDEWGYNGFVMTDWFGGKDPVAQMKAGNHLLMPGTEAQVKTIVASVKKGELAESILDENVEAILTVLLKTPVAKNYAFNNKPDLKKAAQVSREAAAEGMVLLKNAQASLPFAKTTGSVALFGNRGYEMITGGTGSGEVSYEHAVSLAEGLKNAGYATDASLALKYSSYMSDYLKKHPKKSFVQEFMNPTPPAEELSLNDEEIATAATNNETAIFYLSRNAGEGKDRKVENDYQLSETEIKNFEKIAAAFHAKGKRVIAVVNAGGVVDLSLLKEKADAILLAWQPGNEGGNAIADIISGKVNPSGKLATSFPGNYKKEPTAPYFPGKEFPEKATVGLMGMKTVPAEVTYTEGIYMGYRYFNTFNVKPLFEFGYGQSYTSFKYSGVKLSAPDFDGSIKATVTITNTGKKAGKEVVQLYLGAPNSKLDKPVSELKGFAKTKLLQPGASQNITFTLKPEDLASFDTERSSWIADAGKYTISIGASSLDVKSSANFQLAKELIVEKLHAALKPQGVVDELKVKKGF